MLEIYIQILNSKAINFFEIPTWESQVWLVFIGSPLIMAVVTFN